MKSKNKKYTFLINIDNKNLSYYKAKIYHLNRQLKKPAFSICKFPMKTDAQNQSSIWHNCNKKELELFYNYENLF